MTHRFHHFIVLVLALLISLALQGCNRAQPPGATTFEIEAVIQAQADQPLAFDALLPPDGIHYERSASPLELPGKSLFPLVHVIVDPLKTTEEAEQPAEYTITAVEVQEQVDDAWETFSEFHATQEYATDIGVVIVLDNSRSLKGQLDQNRTLATKLAQALLEDKRVENHIAVAILPLAMRATQEITFTTKAIDAELTARAVDTYAYTPLYDGIGEAIELFGQYESSTLRKSDFFETPFQFEEKILVVISDGQDNSSRPEKPDTIAQKAQDNDIDVFVLAVKDQDELHEPRLQKLAGPDPGRYTDLSVLDALAAQEQMTALKDAILLSCRDRFNLYYERSSSSPGAVHRIKFVITAAPKSAVQAAAVTD